MSEENKNFEPITTQEELNRIIGDRVKRAKESAAEKYADYDSLKSRLAEYEAKINDLTASVEAHAEDAKKLAEQQKTIDAYATAAVKSRIAHEVGLPYGMSDRLVGSTEDEIKADALNLKKSMESVSVPLAAAESPAARQSNGDQFANWINSQLKK